MSDAIAVLNAGSSSIKFSLFALHRQQLDLALRGQIEGIYTAPHFVALDPAGKLQTDRSWDKGANLGHAGALDHLVAYVREHLSGDRLIGVGHRVVHGGLENTKPVRVNTGVLQALEQYVPLAPLHQPHNLALIRVMDRQPDLPQVACFDTSFHRSNPEIAQMFALPAALHAQGIRRYGFHGLSYEYIASVLPGVDRAAADGRASCCTWATAPVRAQAGKSVVSTMGFTAVEGSIMRCARSTRRHPTPRPHARARAIEKLIYSQSGLLGVSGVSSDMRKLLESTEPRAKLAVDLFLYRIGRELGSLAAALGGLDAIVFTAGIGERAVPIRERVCRQAAWLGVELDAAANSKNGPRIGTAASRTAAWVIPTNEELMIARHTRDLLAKG
jgi:acetate kinase